MAKYTIHSNELNLIHDQVESFRFRTASTSGFAELHLSSLGVYNLSISYGGVGEGTVKRTDEYKRALEKVSRAQCKAFAEETLAFTQMHKGMSTVHERSYYESLLKKLAPKTYSRKSLKLDQPTRKDVEADLREEAIHLLHNNDDANFTVDSYVKTHLYAQLEQRQAKWQDAVALFESIEDAREEEQNAQYYAAYIAEKKAEEDVLNGAPEMVAKGIAELDSKISVPVELGIDYKYAQSSGLLEVDVILEEAINIPVLRCEMLSTGKVSIKNKLMRDLSTEKTNCILSLTFLLASHLFNVSPNINVVRLAIYNRVKTEAYIWVEFKRRDIVMKSANRINPSVDIYNYATVMNLRVKNDGLELTPIDATTFKKKIAAAAMVLPTNISQRGSLSDF